MTLQRAQIFPVKNSFFYALRNVFFRVMNFSRSRIHETRFSKAEFVSLWKDEENSNEESWIEIEPMPRSRLEFQSVRLRDSLDENFLNIREVACDKETKITTTIWETRL